MTAIRPSRRPCGGEDERSRAQCGDPRARVVRRAERGRQRRVRQPVEDAGGRDHNGVDLGPYRQDGHVQLAVRDTDTGFDPTAPHAGSGRHLGFVNPALYQIGHSASYHQAFHDVTTGTNTLQFPARTITGCQAAPGWNPVTGRGSPNAQVLVPLLARYARS
ncbi:MAG: hypothetical protein ACRDOK_12105 [Streptosporangiaceae bacterium]